MPIRRGMFLAYVGPVAATFVEGVELKGGDVVEVVSVDAVGSRAIAVVLRGATAGTLVALPLDLDAGADSWRPLTVSGSIAVPIVKRRR